MVRLDDYLQVLEKEVNIDFCRSMNRIIFDKTVENDPFTFGFVSQPEEANIVVPEKGICTSKSKERSVEYKKNHDNCMQIVYNIIIIKKLEIVGYLI